VRLTSFPPPRFPPTPLPACEPPPEKHHHMTPPDWDDSALVLQIYPDLITFVPLELLLSDRGALDRYILAETMLAIDSRDNSFLRSILFDLFIESTWRPEIMRSRLIGFKFWAPTQSIHVLCEASYKCRN
jgi:hypothetical protein